MTALGHPCSPPSAHWNGSSLTSSESPGWFVGGSGLNRAAWKQSYRATQWWIVTAQFRDVLLCIQLKLDLASPAAVSNLLFTVTPKPLQHHCCSSYPSYWKWLSEYFPADVYSPFSSKPAFILLVCCLFCCYWSHKASLYLFFILIHIQISSWFAFVGGCHENVTFPSGWLMNIQRKTILFHLRSAEWEHFVL